MQKALLLLLACSCILFTATAVHAEVNYLPRAEFAVIKDALGKLQFKIDVYVDNSGDLDIPDGVGIYIVCQPKIYGSEYTVVVNDANVPLRRLAAHTTRFVKQYYIPIGAAYSKQQLKLNAEYMITVQVGYPEVIGKVEKALKIETGCNLPKAITTNIPSPAVEALGE